ncbi:MAG: DUF899 domain-containing protein [Pseudomonadota bacterium]
MPNIVTRQDWNAARLDLLAEEKAFQKARDALSARRRTLPWVAVTDDYEFQSTHGPLNLRDLFGDHSQLIVQHFMFGDDWDAGCASCSLWADTFNGTTAHLAARDTAFVSVSTASLDQIEAYKARMGWDFDWVSCAGSRFNHDYGVTFDGAGGQYNYRPKQGDMKELPGISVFVCEGASVYHTYSTYSRGLDNMNSTYQYLDLTPKGRDEAELPWPMAWVRRHDSYGDMS